MDCKIIIIGAGVVGLAIARSLSKQYKDIYIIEKNTDFGLGISSRNSEVIHSGIYYPKDSLKMKLCISGRKMLYKYCDKNSIKYNKCGKLIIGHTNIDAQKLRNIKSNASDCGVYADWLIKDDKNTLGAIGLGSAIMALKDRDSFIGWSKDVRLKNLTKIGNNWRYCLIDKMANLGTKVLSLLIREGKKEWLNKYGDELSLLETLVEPPYTGKVYLASSWSKVGMTKGTEFKWINKKDWDKFSCLNWKVCQKHMKYGNKIDENNIYKIILNS